jgi:hypothetical protein
MATANGDVVVVLVGVAAAASGGGALVLLCWWQSGKLLRAMAVECECCCCCCCGCWMGFNELRSIGGDDEGGDCRRLVALFREDAGKATTEVAAASAAGAGDRCIINVVIITVAVTADFLLLW